MAETVLEVQGLSKTFAGRGGRALRAVSDVSFSIGQGETLGLVGESGCGKSTLARLVLRLIEPDEGTVNFAGRAFTGAAPAEVRRMRRQVQIVFQDALSSLNPRMTVGTNISEPMRLQGIGTERERLDGRDVNAGERLELASNARVEGNVYYKMLEMSAGARINGKMVHRAEPLKQLSKPGESSTETEEAVEADVAKP